MNGWPSRVAAVPALGTFVLHCMTSAGRSTPGANPGGNFVGANEASSPAPGSAPAACDGVQVLQGDDRVLSGDKVLEVVRSGYVRAPNEGDRYGHELFSTPSGRVDDPPTRLQRATTLSDLQRGPWYLDQTADPLYVADGPSSQGLIETSVVAMAIGAPARTGPSQVSIENLVVEKYASPSQVAAVGGPGSTAWTMWHDDHVSFTGTTHRVDDAQDSFVGPGSKYYTVAQWQDLGWECPGRAAPGSRRGIAAERRDRLREERLWRDGRIGSTGAGGPDVASRPSVLRPGGCRVHG